MKKPAVRYITLTPAHFRCGMRVPNRWDAMVGGLSRGHCNDRILASGETLAKCIGAARSLGHYVGRSVIDNAK